MNALKCLEFCHEVRGNLPNDFGTALHIINWLAEKARIEAVSPEDFGAIEAAVEAAKELLG